MKIFLSLAVVALIVPYASAQTTVLDTATHDNILIGPVNRATIDSTTWYQSNSQLYTPTQEVIRSIDSLAAGDSVLVVFGSWCPDSHIWVPIFMNIADSTRLGTKIEFLAVPRSPGAQRKLTPGLNIDKVPTFIFYHNGKELGRIVETPHGDFGEDIIDILENGK